MVLVLHSNQFFIKLFVKNQLEQIPEFSFISRFMIKYIEDEEIHFQKIKQLCTSDATHVPVPLIRLVLSAESILAKFMVLEKNNFNRRILGYLQMESKNPTIKRSGCNDCQSRTDANRKFFSYFKSKGSPSLLSLPTNELGPRYTS